MAKKKVPGRGSGVSPWGSGRKGHRQTMVQVHAGMHTGPTYTGTPIPRDKVRSKKK